jgi:hypothetical protein
MYIYIQAYAYICMYDTYIYMYIEQKSSPTYIHTCTSICIYMYMIHSIHTCTYRVSQNHHQLLLGIKLLAIKSYQVFYYYYLLLLLVITHTFTCRVSKNPTNYY